MNKEGSKATNQVKKRSVSVYLPTNEMADRWKRLAEKAGLSLSQYIQNTVEDHIRNKKTGVLGADLDRQIDDLKEQNRQLDKIASVLSDRRRVTAPIMQVLEKGIRNSENEPFQGDLSFWEIANYELGIITFLKDREVVKEQELLDLLCVDHGDTESVKVVNQLLDNMVNFNLIKRSNGEIIWVK